MIITDRHETFGMLVKKFTIQFELSSERILEGPFNSAWLILRDKPLLFVTIVGARCYKRNGKFYYDVELKNHRVELFGSECPLVAYDHAHRAFRFVERNRTILDC